jgi:hypothetical protein
MSTHALPRAAALLFIASMPTLALAGTHWRCELTDDLVRLSCRAEPGSSGDASAITTASVNGTRFPLDPGRRWYIDLWSPPTEMDRVYLLARATICYRSPGCSVELVEPAVGTAAR